MNISNVLSIVALFASVYALSSFFASAKPKNSTDISEVVEHLSDIKSKVELLSFDEERNLRVRTSEIPSLIGMATDVSHIKSRIYDLSIDDGFLVYASNIASPEEYRFGSGRRNKPMWVYGSEVQSPSANTELINYTVSGVGFIYGFFISSDEPNVFKISWTSSGNTISLRIPFAGKGALYFADIIPINEMLPADFGTQVKIVNVNAGESGSIYQAGILIMELR